MGVKPALAIFLSIDFVSFPWITGNLPRDPRNQTPSLTPPYQENWPRAWEGLDLGP